MRWCALGLSLGLYACGMGAFKDDATEETGVYAKTCESPVLEAGFGSSLTFHGGCGDMVLFARNATDTVQLYFRVNGIVATANEAGETQAETWSLPASGVTLNINVGTNLSDGTCDDVLEGEVNVGATYIASGGTTALVVEAGEVDTDEWDASGTASLSLEGVEFMDGNNCLLELGSMTFEDISVGWLPG